MLLEGRRCTTATKRKQLEPFHPGEILLEDFLKPAGITQMAFAKNIG